MATLKFSNKVIIAGLKENIARLESTIASQYWQKGYVYNCKAQIESYKLQISELEKKTHCKIKYTEKTIQPDESKGLVIEFTINGNPYLVTYLPRPCKTVNDLMCVYYNGVRFPTLAKCLKFLNTL